MHWKHIRPDTTMKRSIDKKMASFIVGKNMLKESKCKENENIMVQSSQFNVFSFVEYDFAISLIQMLTHFGIL